MLGRDVLGRDVIRDALDLEDREDDDFIHNSNYAVVTCTKIMGNGTSYVRRRFFGLSLTELRRCWFRYVRSISTVRWNFGRWCLLSFLFS